MFEGVQDATVIPCATCGYDLRAQPQNGTCPECGGSVAEARRVAALPVRPPWADSDPKWRRRVLAGLYVLLILTPLPEFLAAVVPPPTRYGFYDFRDLLADYQESYATLLYPSVTFCVGIALICSRERHRRRRPLDRVRRWGAIGSYVVLACIAASVAGITLLVLAGFDAMLNLTKEHWFGRFATTAGNFFTNRSLYAGLLAAVPAVVIAAFVLADALRRAGHPKLARLFLLAYSAVAAGELVLVVSGMSGVSWIDNGFWFDPFLRPHFLVEIIYLLRGRAQLPAAADWFGCLQLATGAPFEFIKWSLLLLAAVPLTAAQIRSWQRPRSYSGGL